MAVSPHVISAVRCHLVYSKQTFTKMSKENIKRYDYNNNPYYLVRYMRDKALFQRMFSDSRYGSAETAYEAAELYLNELKAAFPPMNRREYALVLRRKKNGIAGVYRNESKSRGKVYASWIAQWCPEEGKTAKRAFSINKYGEERAEQLAIEARRVGLSEMNVEWSENRGSTGNRKGGETQHHETSDAPTIRDIYAFEGAPIYRIHLDRERDPKLRAAAIENYKARHGKVCCEVCRFSFEETYGEMGKDLIEIHHVISLASRDGNTLTRVDELMLICANCHFVVHAGNADENLRRLKILFSGEELVKRAKSANNSMDVRRKQRLSFNGSSLT